MSMTTRKHWNWPTSAASHCSPPDSYIHRQEKKVKKDYLYSAIYTTHSLKELRHGLHSFTCKLHHAWISFVSVHQMAPPLTEVTDIQLQLYYSFINPEWDERLSWPGWLTCSGWFTHVNGHLSATGWAQDRESSPAEDRRSTTVPCKQPRTGITLEMYDP